MSEEDSERLKFLREVEFERRYCNGWWKTMPKDSGSTASSLKGPSANVTQRPRSRAPRMSRRGQYNYHPPKVHFENHGIPWCWITTRHEKWVMTTDPSKVTCSRCSKSNRNVYKFFTAQPLVSRKEKEQSRLTLGMGCAAKDLGEKP